MKTSISYVDYSFSPWWGCSANCDYCFARQVAKRAGRDFNTLTPVKEATWRMPIKWDSVAFHENFRECTHCGHRDDYTHHPHTCSKCKTVSDGRLRVRPRVLCGTMCDWLDERSLPEYTTRIFELISKTPRLLWMMLTKQPQNAFHSHLLSKGVFPDCSTNMWFGVTAESQSDLDIRWEKALYVLTHHLWLSYEPIKGQLSLKKIHKYNLPEWVVVGCMTGKNPGIQEWFETDCIKSIVKECYELGIPVFVKQMRIAGKIVTDLESMPEWARVREFPAEFES